MTNGRGTVEPAEQPIRVVAIVGCGLIGGSLARALRGLPGIERVIVTDRDPVARTQADVLGIADAVVTTTAEAVATADLVIVATPMEATASVLLEAAVSMKPGGILTDVASVKGSVVEFLQDRLPTHVHYVGGHPMAGSEAEGVDASDATLFQGATYLLTPTGEADAEAFRGLAGVLRLLGARVLAVDPAEHDRLVATVSHLPQLLASVLMAHAAEETLRSPALPRVAAGGFRDVTRVAASNPDLWVAIVTENREAVLATLDGFVARLATVREAIADRRWDAVREELDTARAARRALPSKETVGALVQITVPLADRPGILAEVTTALGEAGVNIEDLSMRHASDGTRGALLVAVDGETAATTALTILAGRGYAAHRS